MNPINKTIHSGKIRAGNKKQQLYINISVLLGFLFLFIWTTILFRKTFIDVKIVLLLLFIPSVLASLFLFKKYVGICGYSGFIKRNVLYNILIRVLAFILIAMPIGNFTVLTFLCTNQVLASQNTQMLTVKPKNIYEGISKGKKYTSFEITFNGITKTLRSYDKSYNDIQNSRLRFEMQDGYFGYAFYQKYNFENAEGKW